MRNRKKRCHCGDYFLDNGTCRHGCTPESNPKYLRAMAAKRRANSNRPTRITITAEEKRRASDALAKLDPEFAKQRGMLFGAAKRSHRAGARR